MNGNKQIIHFLSASDRINYGDLIFPIIFQKVAEKLEKPIQFHNYGLVSSNLKHFGALKTDSYKTLLKRVKKQEGKVVIGGGEVFFPDWTKLYSYINPKYDSFLKYYKFKRINKKFNLASIWLVNNRVREPFCPNKKELFNNAQIFYNSVGGTIDKINNEIRRDNIKKSLNDSSLLSVRDKRTYDSLKYLKGDLVLVADSAILMSDFFPDFKLHKLCSPSYKHFEQDYMFVQLGKIYRPENLKKFVLDLKELSNKLKLKVILCPIGLASGHNDDIVLREIAGMEAGFHYCDPKNIFDIMHCISHSKLYIGTSLHGAITAMSFNIPFVGINKKIKKLDSYIRTWVTEEFGNVSIDKLSTIENRYRNWNYKFMQEKLDNQKETAYKNLDKILSF